VKKIVFSQHALSRLENRGTSKEEVEKAIRSGEVVPAKKGRVTFRKNFPFGLRWKGKYYQMKQVMPIAVEEKERIVVVTVYVYYFGGRK